MHRRKIAALITAATIFNISSGSINAFAYEVKENIKISTSMSNQAKVSKFDLLNSSNLEEYNRAFRLDKSKIVSITNNGGRYSSSIIEKAIDGDFSTHWETGKPNNENFENEVILTLDEVTKLNRIVYGSRQDVSKGKGFAEEFEIYSSLTDDGNDFTLVSQGKYTDSAREIVEIKFEETEFKRIKFKFKKANQNWASASEFMLYKKDTLSETIDNIFTDGTMTKLKDEYNDINAINDLEKDVNNHPLKEQLVYSIDLAKEILQGNKDYADRTFTLTQYGDTHAKAKNQLKMSTFGTDLQSTGIVAKPGEVFNIYVEAEDGAPLPQIAFTQQEGKYGSWKREYQLKQGMNTITVPEIYNESWSMKSAKGGAVYLINKYTPEQQGKAPVVRIEGGDFFPLFNSGDDQEKFLKLLKEYKEKLDKDPVNTVDIYEFNADRVMYTGTAKAAYQVFVNEGVDVEESVQVWNKNIQEALEFAGLKDDESDPNNDSTNIRTTIRLMQPFGAAYAYTDHIGVQRHIQEIILRTDQNSINSILWGTIHEVGHQMDIKAREWGEVTNNMWSNNAYIKNGAGDKVPYNQLYKYLAPEKSLKVYNNLDYGERLGMFWQLQLKKNTYWAELESLYRERKPNPKNDQEKQDLFATYSSEIIGMNLTHYFDKYGFNLSAECKENLKKYPNLGEKIWYLNTSAMDYEGNGFERSDTSLEVLLSKSDSGIKLTMGIDENTQEDLLGYEIIKDGKVIGFTSENTYTDSEATDTDKSITYEVVPYAKDLSTGDKVQINSLNPSISVQQEKITLKLNEEFNAMDYAKGFTHSGSDITSKVKFESNVDTTKHGNYQVKYTIEENEAVLHKIVNVEVVSDYDYLSDFEWNSASTVWGTPRRNSNIKGRSNGEIKTFEKGFGIHANGKITYDLSDKEYDRFEALLGVDQSSIQPNNNSSVKFKIIADGETLASTDVLRYYDNMVYVNVPVSGVKELVIEVSDAGNGNTADHCIIVNPKLTTNNSKPTIIAEDKNLKLGQDFNPSEAVKAIDMEDGDLTSQIEIESNSFEKDKVGMFEVVYKVTDKDKNVTSKKINVTVSEDYTVTKSKYAQLSNLDEYNKEFKLPIVSAKNNAGNYGRSVIGNAIDGKMNTHWETNSPNNSSFKNEVTFDLGEVQEISKMTYAARRDANNKGFATEFEVYVSESESGDDFYLAGQGSYSGAMSDIAEFNMSKVKARRVKFKFVKANGDWASLSEVAFYKEDKLADKMAVLFTDENKTEIAQSYNTLEKLEALREEVKNHPAYELFKVELDNAEQIIRAAFPTLTVEEFTMIEKNSELNLMDGVAASDQKDGDITSKVVVNDGGFSPDKVGTYTVTYQVTNNDSKVTTKERTIVVYGQSMYLSDMNWVSATTGWRTVNKDMAVGTTNKIKLNIDGTVKTFDKGIGVATNSEIVYDLDGNYNYFTTYLGTDKNYNLGSTTIRFRIFADGEEVYTSDIIKTNTPAEYVQLDVTGVKQLTLVADDVDGNLIGDFASWADSKLYKNYSNPVIEGNDLAVFKVNEEVDLLQGITAADYEDGDLTSEINVETDYEQGKVGVFDVIYSVTDSDNLTAEFTRKLAITDEETYISDLEWISAKIGSGSIGKDKSVKQLPIRILNENGSYDTFEKGIGTHSYSEIVYDSTGYDIFDTWVGLDEYVSNQSAASVAFKVYVDGKLKAETGVMKSDSPKERLVVDVRDSKELKLVVDVATNGITSDHADWADARFRNLAQFNTDQLEEALTEAENIDSNNYTEESMKILENSINVAKEALNSFNQETVDKAVEELKEAIDSLVEINLDKVDSDEVDSDEINLNEIVQIEDKFLKRSIQKELGISDEITVGQMRQLTSLKISQVESLEGLQHAINLESLDIEYNQITDLSPLKELKKLKDLKANILGGLMSGRIYPKDNTATVSLDVINRNGEKLLPTSVVIKHNKTHEIITLDINDCVDENGVVTIDTTDFDSYIYTITLIYEDEVDNYTSQFMFMLDNN
ncbi:NPCBM/NEW2 domain-containing protein [uncultured Clostridium sp.]|uniref:NPCBM/NEW2 domain-containing protein n=2 Tax=uncultured Clostridium sp. TaxID=59620 RepID=UPI0025D3A2E0|nr:NPCBM/NEW2 domain-containing protein [uncultured Clostridium sp.]